MQRQFLTDIRQQPQKHANK